MPVALIVDDNARNRKLARDVLVADGFDILEAATGAEGIAVAVQHRPDVILMDLRLPDIEGADASRRLRDRTQTGEIPIVAMSALSLAGNDDWLHSVGFAGWIEKPISVATFPGEVRRYCRDDG